VSHEQGDRRVTGIEPDVARELRKSADRFRKAAGAMTATLGTLTDAGLDDRAREGETERLYAEMTAAFQAVSDFAAGLLRPDDAELVAVEAGDLIRVHPLRWRRHRWERWPRLLG
jgi:hypothetical protein